MATYSSTEPAARLRVCRPHHERSASSVESCLRVSFRQSPSILAYSTDSLFIVVSFSGGGARASALSYGVLRELARTPIVWEGYRKRLVDEINIINALSGGSFTAAYYALYHDRIFHDFEDRFLRKDWESELHARIFRSPSNWFRLLSPYFGRAHIFAELLDEALFNGATFNDLLSSDQRPIIFLHASDMATVSRFEFNQRQFDLICSDLSKLPLSVATASSSCTPSAPQSHFVEELRRAVRI